ncbi:hypothetical protein ACJJTC_008984 [Scirpophaga incertulas]
MAYIGNLPPFEEGTQSFGSWIELFDEYCTLNKVPGESEGGTKKALFLTHIGARQYNFFAQRMLTITVSALARKTVREVQEVFSVRLVDIAIVVVIVSCLKRLYRYLFIQEANQPKGSEEVEEKSP